MVIIECGNIWFEHIFVVFVIFRTFPVKCFRRIGVLVEQINNKHKNKSLTEK